MSKHRPPYTFPHLQKFEWIGSLSDWDIFLYTYINLPHLQHLILGHSHPLSRPLDPTLPPSTPNIQTTDPGLWKSFFKRMKSLHTLELTVFHSAEEWLERCRRDRPSLTCTHPFLSNNNHPKQEKLSSECKVVECHFRFTSG
ncbi:hypothetical protein AGABI1DRAFT_115482 [Agaricus bisporus var. burnettii JB137-S8]|uniref:Uncharacterized protein n=1 Tax=Agaricus bisporus var. burnettii (strain JB137-S8 / ATCC MYA-4627 / FGSC 10392) TaxID=597362 RepID=K5WP71_AGABU|nr:uncharacterized protein AGABI1DRAFT_115482 [Agaricus bisporus var. burnettii JB137-S8]EKM77096.1 hypothetical protein AGABI1DRAFT_115482 [Agaricus bisporus var. burnettii JB137-S8]